jgi:hypothetical protein
LAHACPNPPGVDCRAGAGRDDPASGAGAPDDVGTIATPNGPEHVRLARRRYPDGVRWVFTRSTVNRIEGWYGRIRDHWQQEWFPAPLLRAGPKDLLWWQWFALPLLFVLALGAGALLGWASRLAIARFSKKVAGDNGLLARLGAPLTLIWAVFGVSWLRSRSSAWRWAAWSPAWASAAWSSRWPRRRRAPSSRARALTMP